MPQWDHLPNEILLNIFEHVIKMNHKKGESLAQCVLVCRSWSTSAQRLYFRCITISSKKRLQNAKRVFMTQRRNQISLGVFVRKLYYKSSCNRYCSLNSYKKGLGDTFHKIDKLFPNLEVFVYTPTYDFKISFYILYKMILDGYFKSLKEVPESIHTRAMQSYRRCKKLVKERNEFR